MVQFILNKKCIIKGKPYDNGSLILVTPQQASTLTSFGYGTTKLPKQDATTDEKQKSELPASDNTEVQDVPVSKDMPTTIRKSKRK